MGTNQGHAVKAVAWAVGFLVFAFVLAMALAGVSAAAMIGGLESGAEWLRVSGPAQILLQGVSLTAGALLATYVIGVRILGMDLETLRWQGTNWSARPVRWGLALGVAAAALTVLLSVAVGRARWVGDGGTLMQFMTRALETLVVLAPAALSEELIFRGVPLVLASKLLGRAPAVLLMAIVFGLAHALNPNVTPQGVANVVLAGLFLGTAFYCPGGLWTAFAVHLGWNVTFAVSGAAVSGVPFDIPAVDYHPGGPGWLTGGSFGPEGGLLATLALGAGTMIAVRWARKNTA
ncbi:MAG TPA: CPBP family intramembrane glutamic endopeptidase [Gemmatimonadales bacterium]|nr:CPBP family intramembrane glutamic endopeptidase [Gemmatimonadales bacterium]